MVLDKYYIISKSINDILTKHSYDKEILDVYYYLKEAYIIFERVGVEISDDTLNKFLVKAYIHKNTFFKELNEIKKFRFFVVLISEFLIMEREGIKHFLDDRLITLSVSDEDYISPMIKNKKCLKLYLDNFEFKRRLPF